MVKQYDLGERESNWTQIQLKHPCRLIETPRNSNGPFQAPITLLLTTRYAAYFGALENWSCATDTLILCALFSTSYWAVGMASHLVGLCFTPNFSVREHTVEKLSQIIEVYQFFWATLYLSQKNIFHTAGMTPVGCQVSRFLPEVGGVGRPPTRYANVCQIVGILCFTPNFSVREHTVEKLSQIIEVYNFFGPPCNLSRRNIGASQEEWHTYTLLNKSDTPLSRTVTHYGVLPLAHPSQEEWHTQGVSLFLTSPEIYSILQAWHPSGVKFRGFCLMLVELVDPPPANANVGQIVGMYSCQMENGAHIRTQREILTGFDPLNV